jgi:hypothetical protein
MGGWFNLEHGWVLKLGWLYWMTGSKHTTAAVLGDGWLG